MPQAVKRRSRIAAVLAVIAGLWAPAPATAQAADEPLNLQWYHPVLAGTGVALLFVIDEPVRELLQPAPESLDGLADFAARFKDPEVYWYGAGGTVLLGLATKKPEITATGVHIITAYGLAGWLNIGTKWAFGRTRPSETPGDATSFDWFDGGESSAFSSGSAAVVFSLATTLADAIDRRPVSIVLYGGAALNSWARLHANRHWLSDVALGALWGITAAKLVNGEWTVFGLELPTLWTDGRRSGMQYALRF